MPEDLGEFKNPPEHLKTGNRVPGAFKVLNKKEQIDFLIYLFNSFHIWRHKLCEA